MTQPTSQRFPAPALDTLPDDIRTRLLAVQEKSGFVPNVFLTLARRPTSSAPSSPITMR